MQLDGTRERELSVKDVDGTTFYETKYFLDNIKAE